MNIIHLVLGKARLDRMNGINKVAHTLASYQVQLGANVELWGITPTPNKNPEQRAYKLRLFQYHENKKGVDEELRAAIQQLNPVRNIFHIHGSFIPEFYQIGKLLHQLEIAYIISPHGALSPGAFRRSRLKKKAYFLLFEKHLLKRARAVHLLGEQQYYHVAKLIPNATLALIPNGQDQAEFQGLEPIRYQEGDKPVFSFCGRLDQHHKGLDLLLDAFQMYHARSKRGELWIIGDGPDKQKLEEQANRLGIAHAVKFLGSMFGQEKIQMLMSSDAFVHTSRYEGMPMSVLEAAGLGLPCLVSLPTNLGMHLEDAQAGIQVKELSPKGIMNALLQVDSSLDRGRLEKMGINAKAMILEKFNWEDIARNHMNMYFGGRSWESTKKNEGEYRFDTVLKTRQEARI